jgi:hypothetical protein
MLLSFIQRIRREFFTVSGAGIEIFTTASFSGLGLDRFWATALLRSIAVRPGLNHRCGAKPGGFFFAYCYFRNFRLLILKVELQRCVGGQAAIRRAAPGVSAAAALQVRLECLESLSIHLDQ